MDIVISILLIGLGLIVGIVAGYIVLNIKNKNAGKSIERLLDNAKKEAEKVKRESLFEAKEEVHKLKLESEKEIKDRKREIKENEDRLIQRENNMDKRDELFQKRELSLDEREKSLSIKQNEIQDERVKVEEVKKEQMELLSKISGFNKKQAKDLLMKRVEEETSKEIAIYIKERENERCRMNFMPKK